MCQPNEQQDIKKKTGGAKREGKQKYEGHGPPAPLESPMTVQCPVQTKKKCNI